MNVEGFHPNAVPVGSRRPVDTPTTAASAKEARHASAASPQDVERVTAVLRDTYQHVELPSDDDVVYGDGGASRNRSGSKESDPISAEPVGAEIVDLETVVQARGLPLLPEKARQSVLAQDILRAYDAVRADAQPGAITPQEDGFNTLG